MKTRILSFILVCAGTAFAASRAETTTYVDGNLTGVSPNTGGTLLFSDDKAMYFRTGLATVAVPYTAITKADLGATRATSHGSPFYKVWARNKKTETQFLTVQFKNEEGESKTMTLELAQASAPGVLDTIHSHSAHATEVASAKPATPDSAPAPAKQVAASKPAVTQPIIDRKDAGSVASPATKAGSDWWGDDVWKTKRNADMWTKPAPAATGANAPQNQN